MKKQVMGIEPTYPAWKAGVLPLNHTCNNFYILQGFTIFVKYSDMTPFYGNL